MWYSLIIVFMSGLNLLVYATDSIPIVHHTVIESDSILLGCHGSLGGRNYWKHENNVIYVNREVAAESYRNSTSVFGNYSLYINPVSTFHDGVYTCELGSTVSTKDYVHVEVPPEIFISVNKQINVNEIFVEESEEITAVCYAHRVKPKVNLMWMINNHAVSESSKISLQVLTNVGDNLTFDVISTLQSQLYDKAGTLTCISSVQNISGSQMMDVNFTVYATPSMVLTINGYSSSSEVYVDKHEEIHAVCSALGARPEVNLTWLVNDKPTDIQFDETSIKQTEEGTYDSLSMLRYNLTENEDFGTITCISNFERINVTSVVHGTYCTYVLPIVTLSVNGDTTDLIKDVLKEEEVNATCIATGARPAVDVSWLVNSRKFNGPGSSLKTTVKHVNETFETESTISFIARDKEENITCVISSPYANTTYHCALFNVKDKQGKQSPGLIIAFSAIGCALAALLIPLVYVILKKSRGATRRRDLRYSRSISKDVTLSECAKSGTTDESAELSTTIKEARKKSAEFPGMPDKEKASIIDRKRFSSLKSERESRTMSTSELPCPPTLDLPDVPQGSDQPTYYTPPKDVYGGYTKMKDNILQGRMFNEKDICLVCKIKMGKIYNRWMGSVAVTDKTNKCVVLTTAAEAALESKSIHWDAFVERVLELPSNENINQVEGFYIDDARVTYLVYEHLICETLDVRVNACRGGDPSAPARQSLSDSEMMRYLFGILEGVQLLQSYGFLHPGLSTKKVLLTKQGTCKLYDFCLSEDAAYRVIVKKSETKCTLNQFAPEALSKNEYTQASDVWSTANVIWEILSSGASTFPEEAEVSDEDVTVPQWPAEYQEISNNRLFDCWKTASSRRPTISLLKMSFEKIFESLKGPRNLYEHPGDTLDLYVPMKGTTL